MRVAIQIPIKAHSERVENKNFTEVAGAPLFAWTVHKVLDAFDNTDVFIDTESADVFYQVRRHFPRSMLGEHQRPQWFASDAANGNHLISQFAQAHPEYDVVAQLFVTAPLLSRESIRRCIDAVIHEPHHDSALTATVVQGWLWMNGRPVNYELSPDGLPRSQDAPPILRETTGLYVARRDFIFRTGLRCCGSPHFCLVSDEEALDIDTYDDLRLAEELLSRPAVG